MPRGYSLGRRQASVDRTGASILDAARRLCATRPASEVSLGDIARTAGVSRITVYNRFGSKPALLARLAEATGRSDAAEPADLEPREALRRHLAAGCVRWALDPGLHRHLPSPASGDDPARVLAERLAAADQLRPGCSIKEAEDVIGALASFSLFDRLYKDGRRSTGAVTEILMRLAATILAEPG